MSTVKPFCPTKTNDNGNSCRQKRTPHYKRNGKGNRAYQKQCVHAENGFSLADIYDKDGRYDQTVGVTFSADGKSAYVLNVKYTIKEGNVLEIVPEGNLVWDRFGVEENLKIVINR